MLGLPSGQCIAQDYRLADEANLPFILGWTRDV
jgi:hypothetical protein